MAAEQNDQQNQLNNSQASLFIILLTFFVLLTSGAEFSKERSKDIIDSLNKSFASSGNSRIGSLGIKLDDKGEINLHNNFFRDMTALSAPLTPATSQPEQIDDSHIAIAIATEKIFTSPSSAEIKAEAAGTLKLLGETAINWHDKLNITIQIIIPAAELEDRIARKKIMALSGLLGLPEEWLTIGLNTSQESRAEIILAILPDKKTDR